MLFKKDWPNFRATKLLNYEKSKPLSALSYSHPDYLGYQL
jgi:hypothetical protein